MKYPARNIRFRWAGMIRLVGVDSLEFHAPARMHIDTAIDARLRIPLQLTSPAVTNFILIDENTVVLAGRDGLWFAGILRLNCFLPLRLRHRKSVLLTMMTWPSGQGSSMRDNMHTGNMVVEQHCQGRRTGEDSRSER